MPEDDFSQETRIRRLEERFKRFNILSGPDIDVAGSIGQGYAVNLTRRGGATQVGTGPTGPTGPPPPNTGACCFGDNSCLVLTADDCANAGGIYEGDDVPCDPNPCGVCPELTLVCDSISAGRSKCGVGAYDGSNPVYLTETKSYDDECTLSCPDHCALHHTCSAAASGTASGITASYDPATCVNSGSGCTGTEVETFCDGGTLSFPIGCGLSDAFLISTTATSKNWLRSYSNGGAGGGTITCADDAASGGGPYSGPYTCSDNSCTTTQNATLSDEYTTATLISNTEGDLPAYFGHMGCEENEEIGFRSEGQNCVCFASRELSEDERTYAINRFKYQFTFAAATAPFTITWNEHTEFDDMTTSDNPMSASVGIGETETDIFEVLEPSANGTISITDVVCTLD